VKLIALMVGLIWSSAAYGQESLLKDTNDEASADGNPIAAVYPGMTQFFYVKNIDYMREELWVHKSSTRTNTKLKMFRYISELTIRSDVAFFAGDDGAGKGVELWASNGNTGSGTFIIKDIYPGAASSLPKDITIGNHGVLYFSAVTQANGREVWKSNGTTAGTVLIKDIMKGVGNSNPTEITKLGSQVYFVANDGQRGYELWKTNGTDLGTVLVEDINPAPRGSTAISNLTLSNGNMFFVIKNSYGRSELWKTKGTIQNTQLVKNIRPNGNAEIENLIDVNGTLFFTANDGIHGDELWKSDGFSTGTKLVKDLNPGPAGSNNTSSWYLEPMDDFTNVNGILFFTAARGHEADFYVRSDGTPEGTYPIADANRMGGNRIQPKFVSFGGQVYFFNNIPEGWVDGHDKPSELWLYRANLDGLNIQQVALYRSRFDYYQYYPQEFFAMNGKMYASEFGGNTWNIVEQNPDGTKRVAVYNSLGPSQSAFPKDLTSTNDHLYFVTSVEWADQLWRTDGTPNGTIKLIDHMPLYTVLHPYGDKMFVGSSNRVYITDGNAVQHLLTSSDPNALADHMVTLDQTVYIGNRGGELWKSNGTKETTSLVHTFDGRIISVDRVLNKLFIQAMTASNGLELWVMGSQGVVKVKTIRTANAMAAYKHHTLVIGGTLYFVANDGAHGNEVWRSDGTTAGTFMIGDINTEDPVVDYAEHDISHLINYNGSLFVSALDQSYTWVLYALRGNDLAQVTSLPPVQHSFVYNGSLYMGTWVSQYDERVELWKMNSVDGYPGLLGEYGYGKVDHQVMAENVYFTTASNAMWMISSCGIEQVSTSTATTEIEAFGDHLIYRGYRDNIGYEPFIFRNINASTDNCASFAAATSTREKSLKPWPNPYTNEFSIRVNGNENDVFDVQVFTHSGLPIESFKGLKANTDYEHIGATWSRGMYIVKLIRGNDVETNIVVKE